jgi:hypothetical protein
MNTSLAKCTIVIEGKSRKIKMLYPEPFNSFLKELRDKDIKFIINNLEIIHSELWVKGLEIVNNDRGEYQKKYQRYLTMKKKPWCDLSWEQYSLMTDDEIKSYKKSKIINKK